MFSSPCSSQDNNGVERTFGDCAVRKKYSHIDLIHMIDGVETQKATICAGNRCYYLKVYTCMILHIRYMYVPKGMLGQQDFSIEFPLMWGISPESLYRLHHPIVS